MTNTNNDVIEVDDSTWEQIVEKEDMPVVVFFYQPKCPHCDSIYPHFKKYAHKYSMSCKFFRIDIVSNQWTASRYEILATPTFKFFCQGNPVKEEVGVVNPQLLEGSIESFIRYGEECFAKRTVVFSEISPYE